LAALVYWTCRGEQEDDQEVHIEDDEEDQEVPSEDEEGDEDEDIWERQRR
jgi:hypothetical protein